MILHKLRLGPLRIDDWTIDARHTWCLLGGNASGKSLLAEVICDPSILASGEVLDPPRRPALVSFETIQASYEWELKHDDTDFLDRIDYGSTGLKLLLESGCTEEQARLAAARFGAETLLDRGCRQFSSGEMRRVHVLQAILRDPDLLILDEPFEGLDPNGRIALSNLARELVRSGISILLIANRMDDVSDWCTHLAIIHKGQIAMVGDRQEVQSSPTALHLIKAGSHSREDLPPPPASSDSGVSDPIVTMTACQVRYESAIQFRDFDWELRPGQHTLITGPNGSGKTTLLNLIIGDHPQCYTNDLNVFGMKRGSGESIWFIKRHIGFVSPDLHRDHRTVGNVLSIVLSGFFDSIGLYRQPNSEQLNIATQWLRVFGLSEFATNPFSSLSYGQQRLVLIARALVKQPQLLILDEPTQGLDDINRHLVLAYMESLANLKRTTLLLVSHREDEHLKLFRHHLHFTKDPTNQSLYTIQKT